MMVPKKVVLCPECHERVLGGHFARHMKEKHSNETFNCKRCGEKYTRIENLTTHKNKHCKNDPNLFPFKCLCSNTFKTEKKLKNHQTSGRCVLLTTCKNCKLQLPTKKELKVHMVTCQEEAEVEGDVAPVAGLMEDQDHEAEVGASGDVGQGGSLDVGQRGSLDANQGGSGDARQGGSYDLNPENSDNPTNSRATNDNFDNILGDIDLSDDEYNQIVNDVGNISFSF